MPVLYTIGGTWEHKPWGQCAPIIDKLGPQWKPVWISYPAKYASVTSYHQSYTQGKKNLWAEIDKAEEPYCILGYSQGAKIAGDISAALAGDPQLLRSYLIADPERHIDDMLIGPHIPGEGVYGQRRVGPKCRQFAQAGDIVCANQNPVFNTMAGATAMLCIQHPLIWMHSAGSQKWPGGVGINTIKEIKTFIKSKVHISYNTYEVDRGVTVPDWIAKDLRTLQS